VQKKPLQAHLLQDFQSVPPQTSILIADDDEISARFLKRLLLREGHTVSVVTTAEEVLEECALNPPDLVVIDLVAPRGLGIDLCRRLKDEARTRLIPVVIVTSQSDGHERLAGIDAGADDFVSKPFDLMELRARIKSLVRLKRYTDELESAEAVILGLGATIEARDPTTEGHCERLVAYATALGKSLGLDETDLGALARGGYLHDIGKIAVPDSVLLKDGKLDRQETRVMREHPVVGDALCAGLRSLTNVRPIVRFHHERLDGSGYPDGLRNTAVPLLAQIVSVVDVYDALTTERPYHHARPSEEAFDVLAVEASKGWRDRALVDAFVQVMIDSHA
jgi:putative two-component system response regulator